MERHAVVVWLMRISHSGGNAGSETDFRITVNGHPKEIKADIHANSTRHFDKVLLMHETTEAEVPLSVSVRIVEGQETHPDQGSGRAEFAVKKARGRKHLGTVSVTVREDRGGKPGAGAEAVYTLALDAEYLTYGGLGVRYLASPDQGWLEARAEDGRKNFSLPYLVKVKVTAVDADGREHFTVVEGPVKGRKGSLRLRGGVSSLSPVTVKREEPVELVYHKKSLKIDVPGAGSFGLIKPDIDPLPSGKTFDLEIPDHPHPDGESYLKRANFAKVWFRIGDPKVKTRYLHTGSVSLGCATVADVEHWDAIYRHLINRRKDDKHVGTIKIVND